MLILGGAAVMEALTGVSVYAAAFLIPAGVVIYTAVGGLKGTVIAEWLNVNVIYLALLIFMFQVWISGGEISGGISGGSWELGGRGSAGRDAVDLGGLCAHACVWVWG